MGTRRGRTLVPLRDCYGGHPASNSVWFGSGRASTARSRGTASAGGQRNGLRRRHLRAQRRTCSAHADGRRLGYWNRCSLSEGEWKLSEEILATGGAIVSELPFGTFAAPQNFPRRNRILSGISIGVLVVEAGENSGTRVTARCAAEQNRDLYAVPGNVTNKYSWTPNTLIKQGAKLVATWEDGWEELPSHGRLELEAETKAASKPEAHASLLPDPALRAEAAIVLEVLRADESVQIDGILESLETQLTSSEVFTALFELEISGRIRQLPGKNYVRTLQSGIVQIQVRMSGFGAIFAHFQPICAYSLGKRLAGNR